MTGRVYQKHASRYCQRCGCEGDLPQTVERMGRTFHFCSLECAALFTEEARTRANTQRVAINQRAS